MTILIVDDLATNQKLLGAILETEGHSIKEAADGVAALEILGREKVDAIISDILMPRMDGYRFCYEVRASERLRHLPFIFYTSSYTSLGDEKLALEMGADKFLTKPAPASTIIQALQEAMTGSRSPLTPIEPSRELNLMKEYNQQLVAKLEQKNTELTVRNEELIESEAKFRQLAESVTDVFWISSPDFQKIHYVSPGYEQIWGCSAESLQVNPHQWIEAILPEERARVLGVFARLGENEPSVSVEYRITRPDGTIRWVHDRGFQIRDAAGGLVRLAGIATDITERKRAEEQIAEQAAFLDKARDAILVQDLEGKVLFWNKGAERVYGWTRQEALGRNIGELLYATPRKFVEANDLTIRQGEWNGELQHLTKDRNELTTEARWTLIRDNDGHPKSVLAINTDITEKKKIEAQFMRAQRMESIGTLAGGIAHDLNNILAPIMMSISLLKDLSNTQLAADMLATIEVSAKRGADIVRQVLSFARGLEGERIEVQPKHLLKDLSNIIKDTFPKDIRLQFSIPNETWTILGDPTQVHQILLNLCVNARDAMPNGGTLGIGVENCVVDEQYAAMNLQAKAGRYVKIHVTDSGTGIPAKLLDKIFEPFFTTKELTKGTGLGLSTVMAIVKSHEGIINVYSEPGKGTTFTVYLPAMETSSDGRKEQAEQATLPRGNGATVLVVDDEASILTITSQTLQAFGYRVLTATDGAEAVAIYAQHRDEIAVVLTDMMMPVMDGPATIHALMRINSSLKIVAASGLNTNGDAAKVSHAGVKHFLTKPYTAGALLKALRAILDEA